MRIVWPRPEAIARLGPVRKVLAWCRSHPWFTGFAVFLCLGVGLHFFLNWCAERAWQRYKAEGQARGVKFSLMAFARPEIPDAENFAKLPMLQAVFTRSGKDPFQEPPNQYGSRPGLGDAVKGRRVDWADWQTTFQKAGFIQELTNDPVRDTLKGLDHYEPSFKQWSEWRTRPECRFALALEMNVAMNNPHAQAFINASRLFSLRLRAHLELGDSVAAYADFQEGLQAYRMLRKEPTLTTGLIRISTVSTLINAIGDGLKDRAWAPEDLARIEADLAAIRVWDDYHLALSCERGTMNDMLEWLVFASPAARGQFIAMTGNPPTGLNMSALQLIPKRVFRDNQLRMNRYVDELLARVDLPAGSIDIDRPTPSAPQQLSGAVENYYQFFSRLTTSVFPGIERNYLFTSIQLDQARLACALERFRQTRGSFPNSLDELVPEYMSRLPVDPYARAPFRYQRVGEGSFRLYSIGTDRTDGEGKVDPSNNAKRQADDIWLYAPAPAQ